MYLSKKNSINQDWNDHEKIIMDISQPDFLKLQTLYLGIIMIKTDRNKISSIEQLQFLNIPKLEEINLSKNYVYQILTKSLKLML